LVEADGHSQVERACRPTQGELVERRKRNKAEDKLKKRLEESVETAENDLKLLREMLERI
jgi:hypothetical protein